MRGQPTPTPMKPVPPTRPQITYNGGQGRASDTPRIAAASASAARAAAVSRQTTVNPSAENQEPATEQTAEATAQQAAAASREAHGPGAPR